MAGLHNLTAENLQHCHSFLPCVLAKLLNWFIHIGYVPKQLELSHRAPLLKVNNAGKNITVDDFRGISISPVTSKVF